MTDENKPDNRWVIPRARIVYPRLFEPDRKFAKQGEDGTYKVTLLIPKNDDLKEMMKFVGGIALAKWPDKKFTYWTQLRKDMGIVHLPFYEGDEFVKAKNWDWAAGQCVLRASSSFKPVVVGPDKKDMLVPGDLYSGCFGAVQLEFKAYDGNGTNIPDCVTSYVTAVMKTGEGEKIGGLNPDTVFAGISGGTSDEDPTRGAAGTGDDIPF